MELAAVAPRRRPARRPGRCAPRSRPSTGSTLLDPRRVDAAVLDQLRQRQPRDLAADAVERGEHDRLRRVVDDEVDAGEVLERADVAALAADDPALHVVGGELDERDRRLGGVARGDALERVGDEVARAALRLGRAPPPRAGGRGARARGGRAPRERSSRCAFASLTVMPGDPLELAPAARPSPASAPPGAASRCISRSASPCSRRSSSRELRVDLLLLRERPAPRS